MLDFDFRSGCQGGGTRGVIHPLRDLSQINSIRIANIKIGGRLVRHNIGRRSSLGDYALDPRFRTDITTYAVDVVEELDDCFERVASIPSGELMSGRAVKRVFHAVDVHAAGAEARRGPIGRREGVAAYDYVRALENTRFHHHGLGFGRHHLFTWRSIDGDGAR